MLKKEDIKPIHWPSLFLFIIATYTVFSGVMNNAGSEILMGIGFAFIGYGSIRMLPENLFTQAIATTKLPKRGSRKIDSILFYTGFGFLLLGVLLSSSV
ncbi:hypothetical protein [Colwellia sp. E2M01]|uniref:hypothetical protein n=1 Tax=Colwellia sp. E2M01 TaxID=2841561 RepID=UPI001C0A41DA|nr:hypothetical protein [Colwellia sp. E2M01]MBU2871682.1 hypothetical protein [Colwellia sp. E2M01]